MNTFRRWVLLPVAVMAVFAQAADAAYCGYEFFYEGVPYIQIEVYFTIDCEKQYPPGVDRQVPNGARVYESIPGLPFNDIVIVYHQPPPPIGCGNESEFKIAFPFWDGGQWVLQDMEGWIEANLTGPMFLPSLSDPTGVIQQVYLVVDPAVWHATPGTSQDTYTIVDGECPDLPGYLIGTTPITFDPNGGARESPFSTTLLNGTLYRDGRLFLHPDDDPIPTVSQWGLIVLTLLLLAGGAVVLRRRRAVAA